MSFSSKPCSAWVQSHGAVSMAMDWTFFKSLNDKMSEKSVVFSAVLSKWLKIYVFWVNWPFSSVNYNVVQKLHNSPCTETVHCDWLKRHSRRDVWQQAGGQMKLAGWTCYIAELSSAHSACTYRKPLLIQTWSAAWLWKFSCQRQKCTCVLLQKACLLECMVSAERVVNIPAMSAM